MNLFVLRTWLEAKFAKDERGASMVEYILLVALIALAVIAAVVFLKDQVNSKFNDAGSQLSSSGWPSTTNRPEQRRRAGGAETPRAGRPVPQRARTIHTGPTARFT